MTALHIVTETPEIVDPLTGESVDPADLDRVAEVFMRLEEHKAAISAAWAQCRDTLAKAATGSTQTKRALTERFEVKAEFGPAIDFDQAALKLAAARLPEKERARFVRVDRYAVNLSEWKKVREAAMPEDDPLRLLKGAERESKRPAKVSVKARG